ncbi:actin-like ATPase domain-containing protein [Tuber magnatum]|uniref:Actin-like ATPase domain-containing protein n=1 Tax=Tuber magnatum TaxID=42249 RepID=A0A317SPK1_9PEZI|nr:actin-like ATPase domain-containing protein [Tuber magnatum]
MSQLLDPNSIKIGIDFGTTYSGIAWAHVSTPGEIIIIDRWAAGRNTTSAKVPSEIAYTSSGVKWGFGIPSREPRLAWFKLLLDPTKYSHASTANSPLARTQLLIPPGKKPVDVVADYLSELYKQTIDHLEKSLGKDVVEVSPLDFILTVPAVWSDAAKDLTLQAAESAGFGRKKSFRLISEPEAAAVCCLKEIEPNHLNVGDTFVVADCGGGTVDVISYTIARKSPKLEVAECVGGTGAMCGSTVLNERFEELVRDRIGDKFDKMKHEARLFMVKEFNDSLKRNFTDSEDEDSFICPIPGVADDSTAGIEDGMFAIDQEEMRKIFDPVVQEIVQLVQQQVNEVEKTKVNPSLEEVRIPPTSYFSRQTRQVKALVLVGGFGESEYLRSRLQNQIRTNDGRKPSILQPPNAWTAAVRGAVMRGLEGEMVRTRKASRSYGRLCNERFIAGVHPKRDSYIDRYNGEYMCKRRVQWYVQKGEDIKENDPLRQTVSTSLGKIGDRVSITILSSDSPHPPKSSRAASIRTACTLEVDTSVIPKEKFTREIGIRGQPYFTLIFDLLMITQSASIFYQFQVDGIVYRDVKAHYHS